MKNTFFFKKEVSPIVEISHFNMDEQLMLPMNLDN